MKNKILKCMVFSMFAILLANLVAATGSMVVEKDFPITWTTEPNDYIEYKQTAVDDECVIVVPEGGASTVTKGCNTYTAIYRLSGPVQPSVPFYPDGIEEISVTVETHSFLFDKSDFQSGFAEVIKNDFSLRGLEITEEFESNYYIIYGAYPESDVKDMAVGWYSGDKVVMILLSKWDESKVDDDVLNDLTREYTSRYPVASAIQPSTPVEEISEEIRCDFKGILEQGQVGEYRVNGRDYEIEASYIGESGVKFKVLGETTSLLKEGFVYKLVDGCRIKVLDIDLNEAGETDADKVTFCFEGASAAVPEVIERVERITPPVLPADLVSYPEFFIGKDGKFNGFIVVGDEAPSSDIMAATDISAGLRDYSPGPVLLASEVGTKVSENDNFIIVGREANKILVSENLIKLEPLKEGEGLIQVFRDRNYFIVSVTGYSDVDTRNAAKVLSNWEQFGLRGDRVKVLVTEGKLVLSYPPFEQVEEAVEVVPAPIPVEVEEVEIPTCDDGIKNDGETGVDCGGPCRPCVETYQSCMTGCLSDGKCLPFGTRLVEDSSSVFRDKRNTGADPWLAKTAVGRRLKHN